MREIVDICGPNDLHAQIAVAAAKAGKAVFCEKPLARDLAEAKGMLQATEAGVPHMTCKKLILDGALGETGLGFSP